MTPDQLLAAKYVERALKAARKSGLRLYAYTDFGLYLSPKSSGVLGGYTKNENTLRQWSETAYRLPAGVLGDAGAGL